MQSVGSQLCLLRCCPRVHVSLFCPSPMSSPRADSAREKDGLARTQESSDFTSRQSRARIDTEGLVHTRVELCDRGTCTYTSRIVR